MSVILLTLHLLTVFSYSSHSPVMRNQRRLLQHIHEHITEADGDIINCTEFYKLDAYDRYLCINLTVQIYEIEFDTDSFSCFTETEITQAMQPLIADSEENEIWTQQQIEYLRQVGTGVDIVIDAFAPIGQVAYIIMKEIFNFSVTVNDFYEDAIPIVEYFEPPHIHLEIFPSDFGSFSGANTISFSASLPDEITGALNGLQSTSTWVIQREVHDAILSDLAATPDGNQGIFLEWWRTYTQDDVIDLMSNETFFDIPFGDYDYDGYDVPCTFNDSCVNSTWFPTTCTGNETCATLFQWLPYYNDYEDREIISNHDMRLKMTYIGGEWSNKSQTFMSNHLEKQTRALWSLWGPTTWTAGGEFITIGYPIESGLGDGERAYKLIPTKLAFRSSFAYDFLMNILMTTDEYDWINKRIWDIQGLFTTIDTSFNESCNWLKYQISQTKNSWLNWIPSDMAKFTFSCHSYGDVSLQNLWHINFKDDDSLETPYSEYIDKITAERILDKCLSSGDTNPPILTAIQVLSVIAIIIQTIFIGVIIYFRDKVIIKTSAWHIILIMLFAAYFGLFFVFLSDSSLYIVVFIRPIFSQTALILMLTALTGKTWRLQTIKANALKGVATKIEDKDIGLRIVIFYILIITAIIIVQIVFPPQLKNEVFSHALFEVYRPTDEFKYFQIGLFIVEVLAFIYVGLLAWQLRDINKKYNESKYIAIILYNTTLFILLILLFNELSVQPYYVFAAESLLWISMVFI
eukprot:71238_1